MKLIKAVLIIDVQKALCCGEGATYRAEDVIANINELNRKARESDIPVIFIQHETKEGDFSRSMGSE
ncbi:isochorismatase family protein [Aurantivibrio infirmus]